MWHRKRCTYRPSHHCNTQNYNKSHFSTIIDNFLLKIDLRSDFCSNGLFLKFWRVSCTRLSYFLGKFVLLWNKWFDRITLNFCIKLHLVLSKNPQKWINATQRMVYDIGWNGLRYAVCKYRISWFITFFSAYFHIIHLNNHRLLKMCEIHNGASIGLSCVMIRKAVVLFVTKTKCDGFKGILMKFKK